MKKNHNFNKINCIIIHFLKTSYDERALSISAIHKIMSPGLKKIYPFLLNIWIINICILIELIYAILKFKTHEI